MYSKLTKFLAFCDERISRFVHILWISLFIGVASTTYGQESANFIRLELKTGIILEGQALKIEYNDHVDLLTSTSDTLTVPWDDIASMSFIDKEIKERARAMVKPKKANVPFNDSGYFFQFDFGIPLGLDYWGYPVAGGSLNVGYGKSFNHQHHVAATVGYDAYLWPDVTIVPLGLEYYGRFKEQNRSWFYFYGMGYGFPHISEYDWMDNSKVNGGVYFNPGFGITNKRNDSRSWYLKFGYKYQPITASYTGYVWEFGSNRLASITENVYYHRIDIRFGLRFD